MPLPVLSVGQMREWERQTWSGGQTEAEVIRRVGKAVGCRALELTTKDDSILILAGKGNNGADARCCQDHLINRRVDLLNLSGENHDLEKVQALLALKPALVIDGLFGIGLNRPLGSPWREIVEAVNAANLKVLAIDAPSGLNADTGEVEGAAIQAHITLTVGAPKAGLLKPSAWTCVGRLEVARQVGLAPCVAVSESQWILPEDFQAFPSPRMAASHKGTYGHLAIIAGSLGYHGAAVLAARAAQRAQPGLISLFTSNQVYQPVASQLQAVMVHPLHEDTDFSVYDAVVLGPGLAAPDNPDMLKSVAQTLWHTAKVPVLVDASALTWLPSDAQAHTDALRVITPHPGEAARLLKTSVQRVQQDRLESLRRLSRSYGDCFVVLKGHQTLIGRSTGEVLVNSSGNPHLAQGGSGDALSGFLGGLLAQHRLQDDPLKTISYAVWQHGATADQLQNASNNWVVEDLVTALGGIQSRLKR